MDPGSATLVSAALAFVSGLAVGYKDEIKSMLPFPENKAAHDISGFWKGKAEDIEVENQSQCHHLSLLAINRYEMTAYLKQKGRTIKGDCHVMAGSVNIPMKLRGRYVSDEYVIFDFKTAAKNHLHNGSLLLFVRGDAKIMEGYFLTKRLMTVGLGFGSVSLSYQTDAGRLSS